jgi:predicted ArsR family transcriptional regulator
VNADQAEATPALSARRSRVLALLQGASEPLGVVEVAEGLGLHANTARFHLDALVRQGLAERATEDRDVPGRPRTLYTATADSARAGRRSYRLLAEILTSYLANRTERPAHAAIEAGEAWGRFLTRRPAPFKRTEAAAATRQLVDVLDGIGFAPETVPTERGCQVLLHHCPFREAAEEHREVVCAVHLGLVRGVLSELDAPVEVERLDPFVAPDLCVTQLNDTPRQRAS